MLQILQHLIPGDDISLGTDGQRLVQNLRVAPRNTQIPGGYLHFHVIGGQQGNGYRPQRLLHILLHRLGSLILIHPAQIHALDQNTLFQSLFLGCLNLQADTAQQSQQQDCPAPMYSNFFHSKTFTFPDEPLYNQIRYAKVGITIASTSRTTITADTIRFVFLLCKFIMGLSLLCSPCRSKNRQR